MKDQNINPPDFYEKDVEEPEMVEENNLDNIINHLNYITNRFDKHHLRSAFKMILDYSKEPGVNLSEVQQLLNDINENI